jgi:hypothetical protein
LNREATEGSSATGEKTLLRRIMILKTAVGYIRHKIHREETTA